MSTTISKTRKNIGWVLNGLVAAALTLSASGKLFEVQQVKDMLGETGFGDYIPLLGVLELACVALFLIPKTRAFGTFMVVAYLGGVIAVECFMGGAPVPGVALSVLFWVGVFLRKPQTFKA